MRLVVCLLLCALPLVAADPVYAAWAQGRPAEAVPELLARARAGDGWAAWYDAGLAAQAAGDRGRAVACLAAALRRAPERAEIRQALAVLDAAPPPGWLDRLGPLAWPGLGWPALVLTAAGALALGAALFIRRGRLPLAAGGGLALLLVLPGALARGADAARPWAATCVDTHLLDAAGAPLAALPAGTLLERGAQPPWNGRAPVRLADGRAGFVPLADLGD